jgi:hypothetical protein
MTRSRGVDRAANSLGGVLTLLVVVLVAVAGCMSREGKIEAFLSGDDARQQGMARVLADDLDSSALEELVSRCRPSPACFGKLEMILGELWRADVTRSGDNALRRIRCTDAIPSLAATERLAEVAVSAGEALERQTALTLLAKRPLQHLMQVYKDSVARSMPNAAVSSAIASKGNEAMDQLMPGLGSNSWVADPLARMGRTSVTALTRTLNANDSAVRFAAADALVLMGKYEPEALSELNAALISRDLALIAGRYAFYIRLGRVGSESVLLQALSRYFTVHMCVDYLNCGNSQLAEGARLIARQKGYQVTTGFGSHGGPRWREMQ